MNHGTTKIICTCDHPYQDQVYGKKVRVANATQKSDQTKIEVRCTVCSKIHSVLKEKVK